MKKWKKIDTTFAPLFLKVDKNKYKLLLHFSYEVSRSNEKVYKKLIYN
jgi:hypothetical protein